MLTTTTSANHRFRGGSIYENTPDTAYAYTSRADGQAASVTFRPDTAQATSFTTTYGYDANQHLTSAQINDGRPRRVEYVNDAQGQVLVRREADNILYSAGTGKGGDPRAYNYYLNGIQVGSNSNNGNPDPDFGTALGERVARPTNGTGAFVGGADGGSTYADFDQAFDPINASTPGNGTARYTVRQGDTLQSIAASLFGDASLWYIIGEANGLTSSSALTAGQSLTIPGKISNFYSEHRHMPGAYVRRAAADTFRPYDASKAIGDTAPTTPRPPKKANGCGVFGQILLAAVAVAVTALTAGSLGPVGAAVLGSVASQGVGLATGIQDKFSFKGVALAALSAGVSGGLDKVIGVAGKSFGAAALRGAISSSVSQGVAVATGLQSKFSFAGVAAAGIATGVGGAIKSRLGPASNALGRAGQTALIGTSALIASAGARSLVSGTNFGDNIVAGLPDVIGQTVGGFAADKVNDARNDKRAERLANSDDVSESLRGTKEAVAYARDLLSAGARASTVAQEFKNGSAAATIASRQAGDIVVTAPRGLKSFGRFDTGVFRSGQDAGASSEINFRPNPRARIGGNGGPPLEGPRSIQQVLGPVVNTPFGPVIGFVDNLFDLTSGATAVQSDLADSAIRNLRNDISGLQTGARFDTITPPGGASVEGKINEINSLRARRAALEYSVNGNIEPLQVETLRVYQQLVNEGFDVARARLQSGELEIKGNQTRAQVLGNATDTFARIGIRQFLNGLGISEKAGTDISVNRRLYRENETSFKVPDVRIGNLAFDASLQAKSAQTEQVQGFFGSNQLRGVIIVRPTQLGPTGGAYLIPKPR